jgi:hypothetical protein
MTAQTTAVLAISIGNSSASTHSVVLHRLLTMCVACHTGGRDVSPDDVAQMDIGAGLSAVGGAFTSSDGVTNFAAYPHQVSPVSLRSAAVIQCAAEVRRNADHSTLSALLQQYARLQ